MGKQIKNKGKKGKKGGQKNLPSQGQILDLGVATKSHEIRKAKTHKGKKILENKAPKAIENKKKAIFVKGNKSSQVINDLMRDLHIMRGEDELSRVFTRKGHDIHPFDNIVPLESMSSKQDCSLICFGNHQKKRPDNLIIGRTYDGRILDLFEFGIEEFKAIQDFKGQEISQDLKPLLIFQGEHFEFSDKHIRMKNVLFDFFYGKILKEVNITEMRRIIVFTALDETNITFRHYQATKINEGEIYNSKINLHEIGPHFNMKLRRFQLASNDLYKTACKKPKITNVEKKRAEKNMYTTNIGETKGKVFLQQQDIVTLATRKFKKQRPAPKRVKAEDV